MSMPLVCILLYKDRLFRIVVDGGREKRGWREKTPLNVLRESGAAINIDCLLKDALKVIESNHMM